MNRFPVSATVVEPLEQRPSYDESEVNEPSKPKKLSLSEVKRLKALKTREKFLYDQKVLSSYPRYKQFVEFMLAVEMSNKFNGFVTGVIILAGVLAGVQTYEAVNASAMGGVLGVVDQVIAVIFTIEAFVKLAAWGTMAWRYFKDGWNCFDFAIVVLSWVPLDFDFTVLRTIRLLRVLKLLNALPALQILVGSLLKSVKSMVYIIMLLLLLFYLYGVMACFLFKDNDPFHFRSLELSFLSFYRISTFEDWTDIMYINMWGCEKYGYPVSPGGQNLDGSEAAWFMKCDPAKSQSNPIISAVFFCSFTLFATMIVFNLFIGVILTNIDKAREEIMEEFNKVASELTGGGELDVKLTPSQAAAVAARRLIRFNQTASLPHGVNM